MGLLSTPDLPHLKTNNRRGHGGGRDPACQSSFDMATYSVNLQAAKGGSLVGLSSIEQEGPAGDRYPQVYDQLLDR